VRSVGVEGQAVEAPVYLMTNGMASRADQYRHLAQECRNLARTLPPGANRTTVLDMAEAWERLAEQQTDLRKKE